MLDFTSTQAQAKGANPTTSHKEGHTMAIAARPLKASPPPTTDRLDKMYHQLVEIHTITVVYLVECARWRHSNPTFDAAHAGGGWRGPHLRLTDFSPQASLWQRGPRIKPQAHWWARQVGAQSKYCTRNPHHSEPSGWRRHGRDPKGLGAEAPRSSVCMMCR
jgi:hypothetical protein